MSAGPPGGELAGSRPCLAHASCPVVAIPPAALAQDAGRGLRGWRARHRALAADEADLTRRSR